MKDGVEIEARTEKHQKVWGNQAAHSSASTDLAPAFSRIPLLELPRSVPSRVRVRTCSMRCAPQFLALSWLGAVRRIPVPQLGTLDLRLPMLGGNP